MNKIIYTGLASISILTLLIILLVCITNIFNNVYAPFFGGHPSYKPPSYKPSFPEHTTSFPKHTTSFPEHTTPISKPFKIEENILKHSIEKQFLVKATEPRDTREVKVKEILHSLDMKTKYLDTQLKNEIWGDAYTFANTVVVPFMDKVVVKFLLYLHF